MKKGTKNNLQSIAFWVIMFLYLLSSYWFREDSKSYIISYIAFKVFIQFLLSLVIIQFLIPLFLNKKRILTFILSTLFSIYLMQTLYGVGRVYFFEVQFPEVYNRMPPFILKERVLSFLVFVNNITWIIFPTIILIAIQYYRKQKDMIELKEQKKTTELNLLKHQLNPHFLFNTLNNIYTLALKKSDKTPEVIAKLSEILDYILYQCKDSYVAIDKEVDLLENYIALEKVRYGKRVQVIFEKQLESNCNIAPLILLTFVENAFKHGVSQELNTAQINLTLTSNSSEIVFTLKNTKPLSANERSSEEKKSIGMQNTIRQLDLLYPDSYALHIEDLPTSYFLELKLRLHEKV